MVSHYWRQSYLYLFLSVVNSGRDESLSSEFFHDDRFYRMKDGEPHSYIIVIVKFLRGWGKHPLDPKPMFVGSSPQTRTLVVGFGGLGSIGRALLSIPPFRG